jgi:hypothetical protein
VEICGGTGGGQREFDLGSGLMIRQARGDYTCHFTMTVSIIICRMGSSQVLGGLCGSILTTHRNIRIIRLS